MDALLDITAILKPGVFLLWKAGHCVYVGKARCLLLEIAARKTIDRDMPSWVPIRRISFDRVEILPCDSVRAAALQKALITLHNPTHNREPREVPHALAPFAPGTAPTAANPLRRL